MNDPIDIDILRLSAAKSPRAARHRRKDDVHDCVVVVLSDDTLLDALDDLRSRLGGMLEPGPSTLVLDLSRVSRLSSTTLATFLWVKRACGSRAVELVVRRPSRGSVGVLHRTGLLSSCADEDSRARRAASNAVGTTDEVRK